MIGPLLIRIHNTCESSITVVLRNPPLKRGASKRPPSFTLEPNQKCNPFPLHWVDGTAHWEKVKSKSCVKTTLLPHKAKYIRLLNTSDGTIQLPVAIKRRKAAMITLRAAKTSRIVEYRAIADKRRVRKLVAEGKLTVSPVYEIGPSTRRGEARGSYYGGDVYTCYDCGGAIVFRGNPPTPVHV